MSSRRLGLVAGAGEGETLARHLVIAAAVAGVLGIGAAWPASRPSSSSRSEPPASASTPAPRRATVAPPVLPAPALPAAAPLPEEEPAAEECGHEHDEEGLDGGDDGDLLLQALLQDPARVDEVLERLRGGTLEEAGSVTTTLGRFRDVRVLRAAVALAEARDAEAWRRAMALEVLDGLDAGPAAPVALRALADPDPVVRRAAVHALPPRAEVDPERAPTVLAALGAALRRDADAEVRRRAALAIGRWAADAGELGPVLASLVRDPSPDVRAGAAFACELAAQDGPRVRQALLRSMEAGEAPLVRENAARALEVLGPLAEHEQRAVARVAVEVPPQ